MELEYWRSAANRLYYACYYAVVALLVKNEINAYTRYQRITNAAGRGNFS